MFRFYITDTFDGSVKGTNKEDVALNFATSCDYFVVDTATNKWLQEDGTQTDVEEV